MNDQIVGAQAYPRILQLAATINQSVAELHSILASRSAPFPSFEESAPSSMPSESSEVVDIILDATAELHDLLLDPVALVKKHCAHNNSVCLQAISHYRIPAMVPKRGSLLFSDLAEKVGLKEQMICRLLRQAMTMRIFHEPTPGTVAHTKASAMLADPMMSDWLRVGTEEMWPAAVKMMDALRKWPRGSEPNETGFCLANNTTEPLYEVISRNPERAGRFANAVKVFATRPEYDPLHIINNFDWASLGQTLVLDVGGGQGHVAFELARRFENLSIVVQDMPNVIQDMVVPPELRPRVSFSAHDLFAAQSIKADVVYFRWILHNWSDKYCVRILRAQIPVLKTGSRLIIQDTCMPRPGMIPLWKEKDLRANDIDMAATFNSREREIGEWESLLKIADHRFRLNNITQPKGSALSVIEVIWHGDTPELREGKIAAELPSTLPHC